MFDKNSWQLEDITFILNEYSELLQWGYKDETVLHFGCGSGFITGKFLLPHLPSKVQVVGVEEDHNLVEFAKKYHEHDKVEYRKLKEIEDCVFDHILSFYYFKETIDELKLFSKFNQYLSKNGDLLMILLNEHSVLSTLDKFLEKNEKYGGMLQQTKIKSMNASQNTLLDGMTDSGFSNIICKSYERYHIFPSKSVLKKFLKNNLIEENMPKPEFEGFFSEFLNFMQLQKDVKRIGRNKNGVALPYKLTFLYGKKQQTN